MPDVHADPEKLKQLAKELKNAADQLQSIAKSMSRALERSDWNDPERRKFEQDFSQTLKDLRKFTDKLTGEYSPALLKKAAILEQYRRGR